MEKKKTEIIGLVFSALGALILALAFLETNDYVIGIVSGIQYHGVVANSFALDIGIGMLGLGFIMQLVAKLADADDVIPFSKAIVILIPLYVIVFILIAWLPRIFFR